MSAPRAPVTVAFEPPAEVPRSRRTRLNTFLASDDAETMHEQDLEVRFNEVARASSAEDLAVFVWRRRDFGDFPAPGKFKAVDARRKGLSRPGPVITSTMVYFLAAACAEKGVQFEEFVLENHPGAPELHCLAPFLGAPRVFSLRGCVGTRCPTLGSAERLEYFNTDGVSTDWMEGFFSLRSSPRLISYSALLSVNDGSAVRDFEAASLAAHPTLRQLHLSGGFYDERTLKIIYHRPPRNLVSATLPLLPHDADPALPILALSHLCPTLRDLRVIVAVDRGAVMDPEERGWTQALDRAAVGAIKDARLRLARAGSPLRITAAFQIPTGPLRLLGVNATPDLTTFVDDGRWGEVPPVDADVGLGAPDAFIPKDPLLEPELFTAHRTGDMAPYYASLATSKAANESVRAILSGVVVAARALETAPEADRAGKTARLSEVGATLVHRIEALSEALTTFVLRYPLPEHVIGPIIAALTRCRKLSHLILANQKDANIPVGIFLSLPRIRLVDFSNGKRLAFNLNGPSLRTASRSLTHVFFGDCEWLNETLLSKLAELPLRVLSLRRPPGSKGPVSLDAVLQGLSTLVELHAWNFETPPTERLEAFLRRNPDLVVLAGVAFPTAMVFPVVAKPGFVRFHVSQTTPLTGAQMALIRAFPEKVRIHVV